MRERTSAIVPAIVAFAAMCVVMTPRSATAQANDATVGSVLAARATVAQTDPEIAALEAQLHDVQTRPHAEVATTLIDEARSALQRARAWVSSDPAASKRAREVVTAALAAASYTIARHVAEQELTVAQRRLQLAKAAAATARQALEAARAQRATVGVAP